MLLRVSEFRQWVEGSINGLVDQLGGPTRRYGGSRYVTVPLYPIERSASVLDNVALL